MNEFATLLLKATDGDFSPKEKGVLGFLKSSKEYDTLVNYFKNDIKFLIFFYFLYIVRLNFSSDANIFSIKYLFFNLLLLFFSYFYDSVL